MYCLQLQKTTLKTHINIHIYYNVGGGGVAYDYMSFCFIDYYYTISFVIELSFCITYNIYN